MTISQTKWKSCASFIHEAMRKILKCLFVAYNIDCHHPFTLFWRDVQQPTYLGINDLQNN